jgi:hypothetical protein
MIRLTLDEYTIENLTPEMVFDQRRAHIDEYMDLQKRM